MFFSGMSQCRPKAWLLLLTIAAQGGAELALSAGLIPAATPKTTAVEGGACGDEHGCCGAVVVEPQPAAACTCAHCGPVCPLGAACRCDAPNLPELPGRLASLVNANCHSAVADGAFLPPSLRYVAMKPAASAWNHDAVGVQLAAILAVLRAQYDPAPFAPPPETIRI